MPNPRNISRKTAVRRAFTLLELLVVIGIIVLLAGLVLAVSSSVIRASEERATQNTLTVLDTALEEFERTLDRKVTYRSAAYSGYTQDAAAASGLRYDVESSPPAAPAGSGITGWTGLAQPYAAAITPAGLPAYSNLPFRRTVHLIWAMTQTPSSAAVMAQLPDSVFRGVRPSGTSAGYTAVRHCIDSWETPIIAVFPGREATANDAAAIVDVDGTVKSDSEWATVQQGGYRASCKDRRVLFVSAGNDARLTQQNGANYEPSADNLVSYQP